MRSVTHKVATLREYDMGAGLLPSNAFRNLSITFEEAEPNSSMAVLVSPSRVWKIAIDILKRLLPNSVLKRIHMVPSRESALLLLAPYLDEQAA